MQVDNFEQPQYHMNKHHLYELMAFVNHNGPKRYQMIIVLQHEKPCHTGVSTATEPAYPGGEAKVVVLFSYAVGMRDRNA